MWLANNDIYVVEGLEKEILIPVIPEVVKNINHSEKKIYIEPMDGLLD
jgi:ribosomal 30S subunit maturation factor RimM